MGGGGGGGRGAPPFSAATQLVCQLFAAGYDGGICLGRARSNVAPGGGWTLHLTDAVGIAIATVGIVTIGIATVVVVSVTIVIVIATVVVTVVVVVTAAAAAAAATVTNTAAVVAIIIIIITTAGLLHFIVAAAGLTTAEARIVLGSRGRGLVRGCPPALSSQPPTTWPADGHEVPAAHHVLPRRRQAL
jgi:amino acid transporter